MLKAAHLFGSKTSVYHRSVSLENVGNSLSHCITVQKMLLESVFVVPSSS